jgi:hypothetical protein
MPQSGILARTDNADANRVRAHAARLTTEYTEVTERRLKAALPVDKHAPACSRRRLVELHRKHLMNHNDTKFTKELEGRILCVLRVFAVHIPRTRHT